jgi:mono/diheme cytochrome c family protein
MKRLSAFVLTFVLIAAVRAQPGAPPPSKLDLKEAKAGEVIYVRYCASCHGLSMKGDGAVASGLKNVPTDLTILSATNKGVFPYDRVASIIDGRTGARSSR